LGELVADPLPLFDRIEKSVFFSDGRALISSLHPGFWNPSMGTGVIGVDINPANHSNGAGFLIIYGFPYKIPIETDIDLYLSNTVDTFYIPLDMELSLQSRSQFEWIGGTLPIGKWNVSLCSFRDLGLRFDAYSEINDFIEIDTVFHLTRVLTHNDLPQIPEGDSIPVDFQIEGKIRTSLLTNAHFNYETLPLIFSLSRKYGKYNWGFGIRLDYIEGRGWGILDLNVDSASFDLEAVSSEWTVEDLSLVLKFSPEMRRFAKSSLRWSISGFRWGLNFGVKRNYGPLKLGVSAGWTEGFKLRRKYEVVAERPDFDQGGWVYDSLYIDSLYVDTSRKVISGIGLVYLPGFELKEEYMEKNKIYSMGRTLSLSLGFSYRGFGVGIGAKFGLGEVKNNEYFLFPSFNFNPIEEVGGGLSALILLREIQIDGKRVYLPHLNFGFSISFFTGSKPFERLILGVNLLARPPLIKGYYKAGEWEEKIDLSRISFVPSIRIGIGSSL
jgi:hypothetical protein